MQQADRCLYRLTTISFKFSFYPNVHVAWYVRDNERTLMEMHVVRNWLMLGIVQNFQQILKS